MGFALRSWISLSNLVKRCLGIGSVPSILLRPSDVNLMFRHERIFPNHMAPCYHVARHPAWIWLSINLSNLDSHLACHQPRKPSENCWFVKILQKKYSILFANRTSICQPLDPISVHFCSRDLCVQTFLFLALLSTKSHLLCQK